MKYFNELTKEEQKYYKDKRCAGCLWEKPCKIRTCENGIYSNQGKEYMVWGDHGKLDWIVSRYTYNQFGKIHKLMKIKKGEEDKAVEFMLKDREERSC